ncbi:two-component system, sensor histidine kinase YesM [Paenibacillus sophorae]|uniref:histidine kinase n=1 Tax=Paenibacillus sophorae TaxID=1333845 RepID=A0A1H8LNG3_9BACL|nr:sensor histidine kinase [Paenibacillus sophorae]QWU17226.1 sensor histidine kinase [Paenibacillus sophorae]SEO06378.1 two-component system, sensor histidine kinase YesM [Paenibacillus sophorae]
MFKHSIRNRLMALVLLAAVIPAGVSVIFSYLYTKQSVTEQSVGQNRKLLALGAANLDNYFQGIDQRALSIYSGINVQSSFYTSILSVKNPNALPKGTVQPDNRNIVSTQLYNLFLSDRNIFQIHLYVRANKQSNTLLQGQFRREYNPRYTPLPNQGGSVRPFVEATHMDHQYGMKSGFPNFKAGATPVFSAHYPIYRTPSHEVIADLSLDFRLTELEAIAKSMYNSDTERLYIVDEQGKVLYASGGKWIGKPIEAGWSKLPQGASSGHFSWNNKEFKGIIMYRHIDSAIFKGNIIKLVPYEDLYRDARTISRINTGIGVLFLIIAGIAGILISIGFTRPIKKLISYTQKVQIGQLDASVDLVREDEFGVLARKITDMTRTINDLILQEYRLEIANKTSQLKMLQAQVNPHFLYNALQSIATLSLRYNAPKIYDLIYSLGSMMRYSMTTDGNQVTLQDEIEHVQNYAALQRERFGEENLRMDVDIEERASGIFVPKMILQPLVENIFKHGFRDGIKDGVITISGKLDANGRLIIMVRDNGKGIPDVRLKKVRECLERTEHSGEDGIGLRNVLARLRLQISERSQLLIQAGEYGVEVVLIIPLDDTAGRKEERAE